ncbi:MAG: 4Fe-4S dicluster domain-containing protein [bacterium]
MIRELQAKARELLKEKKVDLIIGYEKTLNGNEVTPSFIEKEKEVEKLFWNEDCVYNLSRYLVEIRQEEAEKSPSKSGEKPASKIVGIVAKGCDVRSIIGLIQEKQIKREEVMIIGVECDGVRSQDRGEMVSQKCRYCEVHIPKEYDILIKNKEKVEEERGKEKNPYVEIEEMEAKSIKERWLYWQAEFSRCIRCYACRQICPMCFCKECIADKTMPQWILPSPSPQANTVWNLVRAFHLAGRCIDCGECERACPVNIPLRKLNKKLEKEINQMFGYEAGLDPSTKPPLADFRQDDPQEFIR